MINTCLSYFYVNVFVCNFVLYFIFLSTVTAVVFPVGGRCGNKQPNTYLCAQYYSVKQCGKLKDRTKTYTKTYRLVIIFH